ncbi:MAG TPA: PAS domain-containing sensor histidine kinase [Vicinamibacterales bacterium]|nr:PAS domain-containing sensor histidine kinase [Vicinamibacterales bacterium]
MFASSSARAVTAAAALAAVIAYLDRQASPSIGLLYLFPILLVGTVLPRWQIVAAALGCTWLTAIFNPWPLTIGASLAQDALVFVALGGTGLVAYELTRRRREEADHRRVVEHEAAARRQAEEQLAFVIDTSPAAVLTMTGTGTIVAANAAAHRVFGLDGAALCGRSIAQYIPALARVPARLASMQTFHTEMRCRGQRDNGSSFPADVFFSTYGTAQGPRLAAMVIDTSADLVDREEAGLEQLMASSRVLVSAMTHEVRNLCGAVAVVHENLARTGTLRANQDFEALGTLVEALTRIASVQLRQNHVRARVADVDLLDLLDELRIVLDAVSDDAGIPIEWCLDVSPATPVVSVDQHHLLQALLNLIKNSHRALQHCERKRLTITVVERDGGVSLRIQDSGPGPAVVEHLFQPFQKGAACTGLGLYVSRALVRSFRGDLRYDPDPACTFVIELPGAARELTAVGTMRPASHDTHSAAAR